MHYVTKLKNEAAADAREIEALRAGLRAVRRYLTSDKFREDTTVQVGDVLLRIAEVESIATDARIEAPAVSE